MGSQCREENLLAIHGGNDLTGEFLLIERSQHALAPVGSALQVDHEHLNTHTHTVLNNPAGSVQVMKQRCWTSVNVHEGVFANVRGCLFTSSKPSLSGRLGGTER